MRLARLAAAAVAASLLVGCDRAGNASPTGSSPADSLPATSSAGPPPGVSTGSSPAVDPSGTGSPGGGPPGWPAGIVTTTYSRARPVLSVADPATGQQRLRVGLPGVMDFYWSRASFSADWSLVAWATGAGPVTLHVAELRGASYQESGAWKLPGSKRRGATAMLATFRGGTSRVVAGWFAGTSGARLFSIDARQPGGGLRAEKGDTLRLDSTGRPAVEKTVSVTGRPGWGGALYRTESEALYAVVQSVYTCDVRVSATVLACWGDGPYGRLATLTMHGTGGRVSLRKLVDRSVGETVGAVASPDGRTLMYFRNRVGWFAVPVDGSSPPKRRFGQFEDGYATPIDWL